MTHEEAILYSKMPEHKAKVRRSQWAVKAALNRCSWVIAFSGGKDATAMLHIVETVAPGSCRMVFFDDEINFPETHEYLDLIDKLHPGRLIRQKSRDQHGMFTSWINDDEAMTSLADFEIDQGIEGTFIGIRAEENATRMRMQRQHGRRPYQLKSGQWHCNPIIDWTVKDVWAFIYAIDVPFNKSYLQQQQAGLSDREQRVIPFGYRKSLDIMRRAYPDLYNRCLHLYPQMRSLS